MTAVKGADLAQAVARARHPLDPDPVRSTKTGAVLLLGIVAAATGFFLGGLVPATIALLLARQARAEMAHAGGFLTGGRRLRTGVALAWVGIALAATGLVIVSIIGLLHVAASHGGQDFAPTVN
jgi:(hydroxyamino)benzene mutase